MAWTVPDKGEGVNDLQSILFQEYLDALVAGVAGTDCVLSGLEITGGADMTPAVAKGAVLSNGTMFAVAAADVTVTAADATHPRIDLIVVTNAGALAVRAGTPAAAPKPPARSANDVVIGAVYVPAGDTAIATNQVTDMRVLRTVGPIKIAGNTANVNSTNTNGATTFFTQTIPNGLFLTGKKLRLRAWGVYFCNVNMVMTLNIAYGGTALFTDSTAAANAGNTNQGAWDIEVLLNSQADAVYTMAGSVTIQGPGAKTNAAVGIGELGAVNAVGASISGTGTVNSNNANRDLVLTWAMNVNSAGTGIRQYGSILELM